MKIEYRVRPVTRYIVTVYQEDAADKTSSVGSYGEFANEVHAGTVANALGEKAAAWHEANNTGAEVIYPSMIDVMSDDPIL